jgi:replicative DNA helicase
MNIEKIVLSSLVHNKDYFRKASSFLKEEYFSEKNDVLIFKIIKEYIDKYNDTPSLKTIAVELSQKTGLSEEEFKECKEIIVELNSYKEEEFNGKWLIDETEKFCKEKALHNAIVESINIIDKNGSKGSIPELITNALSVSFDTSVGHDYFEEARERYEEYVSNEKRIPFKLEMFNKITNGGLIDATLNIIIAGTGVGKSLMMGSCAADNLLIGKNVLYITLEMAAKKGIGKRIDANLLDMNINSIDSLGVDKFLTQMERLKMRATGKLVIEEYPTSSASVLHFRHLLYELKIKKNFVPDIIYIDYLGICASSRLKLSNQVNSYTLQKAVAEELRALAKEYNVPIVTAVQMNREGSDTTDPKMKNTSDSFGVPFTADLMFALVSTDELNSMNQMMVVQLKNRYNDVDRPKKFMIGVDKTKMKFFDLDNTGVYTYTKEDSADEDPEEEHSVSLKDLKNLSFDKKKAFDDFV